MLEAFVAAGAIIGLARTFVSDLNAGDEKTNESWLGSNPKGAFKDIEVVFRDPKDFEGETGIISVSISSPNGQKV